MNTTPRTGLSTLAMLWTLGVILVAANDGFVAAGPVPWPTIVVVGLPIAAVAVLMSTGHLETWASAIDPRWPAAIQLWRVVGAAFLFGWQSGHLPAGFALPAGIGDVATGVAALWFLAAIQRGSLTRRHLVGFTALGIGDFLVAVVVGIALGPANLEVVPWILFPALAVPFFTIVHAISWVRLSRVTSGREVSNRVRGSSSISSPAEAEVDRAAAASVATAQT